MRSTQCDLGAPTEKSREASHAFAAELKVERVDQLGSRSATADARYQQPVAETRCPPPPTA